MLSRARRALAAAALVLVATACAAPMNPPLASYGSGGYRYATVRTEPAEEEVFVILAFSGGGTRAAAFSQGVLDGLQRLPGSRPERSLLEDVDVISSVSGGSFTAAHYALFGPDGFKRFQENFLDRDIQGELVARALAPWNWFRLLRPDFSRIDLAAELYDEVVFGHATFGTLIEAAPHRRPYVLLNATDMTLGTRFEFTQDQFDLLCSNLSAVTVARAVAASSAFPVLLSPLTLQNHSKDAPCNAKFTPPRWLENAQDPANPPRRAMLAQNLMSYRTQVKERRWIHLLDGGLADNIGLRGPYVALSGQDSAWSVYSKLNNEKIKRVLVITANARTRSDPDWDAHRSAPGISGVLGLVTTGPMGNYSFETVQLVADHFARLEGDLRNYFRCEEIGKRQCDRFAMPNDPPTPAKFHAVELAFANLPDTEADLKRCLEGMATSFHLPPAQVELLRLAAQRLLMQSKPFAEAMQGIKPGWQPSAVEIPREKLAAACPAR